MSATGAGKHNGRLAAWTVIAVCAALLSGRQAQAADGSASRPRRVVESPTARLLPKGDFDLDLRVFTQGGILGAIGIGLMDRITIGFSFGGTEIIGSRRIEWNPRVEFSGKYLLFEDSRSLPAVALGFESQGYGAYDPVRKTYATRSVGFYAAASREYGTFLGSLGLHGGVSVSVEGDDSDTDPSGFVGIDKSINNQISVLAEYNARTEEVGSQTFSLRDGQLNVGVRWSFNRSLDIELDVKNLLRTNINREIRLVFLQDM